MFTYLVYGIDIILQSAVINTLLPVYSLLNLTASAYQILLDINNIIVYIINIYI